MGWVRLASGGPVDVLLAGSALLGSPRPGPGHEISLALPAGGFGQVVAPGGMAAAMNALPCWTRISGIADGLLAEETTGLQLDRASLEECLFAAWDGPFAWLILADPLALGISRTTPPRWPPSSGWRQEWPSEEPEKSVQARRLEQRHTELRQALSSGLWQLHVLAGAPDPAAAARIASLLCRPPRTFPGPSILTFRGSARFS